MLFLRLLILLIVVLAAIQWSRRILAEARQRMDSLRPTDNSGETRPAKTGRLVRCDSCGVHFVEDSSLKFADRSQTFCSEGCRQRGREAS